MKATPGSFAPPADGPAREAALDLHEGIGTPPPVGCPRWPESLRLRNELTGELVRGRCRATNLCPYCARLAAVETSELLMLDAMDHAPALYVVLTARELLERADCRDHLRKLRRSLKLRWPSIEWAVLVEFQRRGALHLNLLVKGVPAGDARELHERISAVWCKRVDAEPHAQYVGEVSDGGGLVRYIALHFLKPEQAPPIGWRGHRISYTGGYLAESARVMRRRARESLQLKRELWRAIQRGEEGANAELTAQLAVRESVKAVWVLTTDRGARLSPTCHDPRRMALTGSRGGERDVQMGQAREVSAAAPPQRVGMPKPEKAAGSLTAKRPSPRL